MSYQVIARRYRPQNFEDVIGQKHVTDTLSHSIDTKRIGHAFLFCGPRGTGKTTTARILAKALNCIKGPTSHPCNQCPSCISITDGSGIDVIEIDAASNRGIDDARQLREYIQLAPSGASRYRVYIIDEVHMLTTEAFNALLKTLEEPPAHAIFVLATTEKHKVPITIISRCQSFDFKHISLVDITRQLSRIFENEKDLKITKGEKDTILGMIARAGRGSMRDAESLLEQLISFSGGKLTIEKTNALLGTLPSELLAKLVDAILSEETKSAMDQMAALIDQGLEFEQLCNELLDYFRSLTIIQVMGKETDMLDLTTEEKERQEAQAKQVKKEQLVQMMKLCTHSIEQIRKTVPGRVVMDLLVLDCIQAKQTMPLNELIGELKRLQKELNSPNRPKLAEPAAAPRTINRIAAELPPSTEEIEPSEEGNEVEPSPPESTYSSTIGVLSAENLQTDWKTIQEQVGRLKPSLITVLSEIQEFRLEKNQVILSGGSNTHRFHKSMLDKPENREVIESVLGKYYQASLGVRVEALSKPVIQKVSMVPVVKIPNKNPAVVEREPIIQKAIQIFGADNLETRIKPKIQELEIQEEEK